MLLLLAWLACTPSPTKGEGPFDRDGDGHLSDVDCDDAHALVNPAAPELCDGLDNDCDGQTDEDPVGAPVWFADRDADGLGDPLQPTQACTAPAGTVPVAGDCDDQDPTVGNRVEICDGLDNDCDARVDEDGADALTWYKDMDGDGWGDAERAACTVPSGFVARSGDCDDDDPRVHPGADELCAPGDEDCDGFESEDAADAVSWYLDGDRDGAGAGDVVALACTSPGDGYSPLAGDCDDADPTRSPELPELCGGGDENCDGAVDRGAVDAPTWYTDADGDGWGDWNLPLQACEAPSGASAFGGDCDETDEAVSPDALEVCGDGLDNDCDGLSLDGCGPGGARGLDSALARLDGSAGGDGVGGALAAAGDLNADGYGDLVLGASGYDTGAANRGAAFVVFGPLSGDLNLGNANATLRGASGGDSAGSAVAGPGDVNGDGYDDLFIGAQATDSNGTDAGAAYLVLGPPSGTADLDDAALTLFGEAADDFAGAAVAGAGDVDGDGRPDLAVGAIGVDHNGSLSGAVYLLYAPLAHTGALADADLILYGEAAADYAGDALAGAGDVDGDGLDDLLIGARGYDAGNPGSGAAYLVCAPGSGAIDLSAATARLTGEARYDYAADAVAGPGDVNGDGYDDLLIGARSADANGVDSGAAYLVLGPVSGTRGLALADARIVGENPQDYLGYAVSGAGDVNADGYEDLLVGAHYYDGADTDSGAAWLLYGPVSGTLSVTSANARFTGLTARDYAGGGLSGAGDLDADGYDDLLIGAYGYDGAGADAGAAWVFAGGPGL